MISHVNSQTQLSQYNNSWYKPGSTFKRILWIVVNTLFFNNGLAVSSVIKCFLLKLFGARVGKRVVIKPLVNIKYPWFLQLADDVWIGENVWIDNLTTVSIGNNVCISQGTYILTGNHNYKKPTFDLILGSVVIENGVWLGAKSTVCPGVTCRSHSILEVGSVATKDLQPYSIYQGNPAILIKQRVIE